MINSILWVNMKKNYLATLCYSIHIGIIFLLLAKRLDFGKRVNAILPTTQFVSFLFSAIFLCKAPLQSFLTMSVAVYSCFYYNIKQATFLEKLDMVVSVGAIFVCATVISCLIATRYWTIRFKNDKKDIIVQEDVTKTFTKLVPDSESFPMFNCMPQGVAFTPYKFSENTKAVEAKDLKFTYFNMSLRKTI